uniref:Uncharacterized protein n=1 Tax=Chromera velia CCMP2878 TaxID=1169474 RepID=A0A0G4HRT5_9ALVE|eukprot:Cvel_30786.t1-p1 / transcript=Cvel_30786.t1 / gene=Cvel_30786 / organism=Chromera_velia_CCMP2878 / gene_product=hypothetical protein / transcript_product=hypothetical protein / location=Cvel_scaffold4453:4375-8885(-) / protein_length=90 / sequence_SO=supercontig / SO=protein_coding / is_pseudo=false
MSASEYMKEHECEGTDSAFFVTDSIFDVACLDTQGDADALEALWVLWVSPLPLAARELMGALDGGLGGASRLCTCICVEPDGVPAGVSLR